MKKQFLALVFFSLFVSGLQASVENLATMSDIKEVIQILLKSKNKLEGQLNDLERELKILIDEGSEHKKRDERIEKLQNTLDNMKSQIENIMAAIKEIDPNNIALKSENGENFLAQTFTTQKETEELRGLLFDELKKIKDTIKNIPQSTSSVMYSSYEVRLKALEEKMKNCGCGDIPENEIK